MVSTLIQTKIISFTEGTNNYENINGSEGNGDVQGYVYPDTEDLDGDYLQILIMIILLTQLSLKQI